MKNQGFCEIVLEEKIYFLFLKGRFTETLVFYNCPLVVRQLSVSCPLVVSLKCHAVIRPPLSILKLRWPWTLSWYLSHPRAPNVNVGGLCFFMFFLSMSLGAWLNIEIGGAGAQLTDKPTEFKFSHQLKTAIMHACTERRTHVQTHDFACHA